MNIHNLLNNINLIFNRKKILENFLQPKKFEWNLPPESEEEEEEEEEIPIIDPLNIHKNTYIYQNIQIVNKNNYLRKNNEMIELKTTDNKRKSHVKNITYDKSNIMTNSIDIAFKEANLGKDVYLLVFGDFRYPGGGVTLYSEKGMPKTQEEQIFIRTNACKIYRGNDNVMFNNKDQYFGDIMQELKQKVEGYGYWINDKERHFFFNRHAFRFLTGGGVYLIKDIYMLRDANGNLIDNPMKNKPINLLYAVAPMYIKPHSGKAITFTDEEGNNLNTYGQAKVERYKQTVNNIFSFALPNSKKKKVLIFGKFGMGVYIENDRHKLMGLSNRNNIEYVKGEYNNYIQQNINNTVYNTVYNVT